jgi:serine/threonine protein kinase
MRQAKSLEIFVSYSHHDRDWRERLFDDYLHTTFGDCRIWTDAQIRAGDRWSDEINRRLQSSSVAVLLVSERFLKSKFIMEREFPTIMTRAREAGLRVVWIPIAIRREALVSHPDLDGIQAATGFDDMLPADPLACPPAVLDRVRQHVRHQMMMAVDPVGAEAAKLLSHRYELGQCINEGNLAAVYQARDRVLQRTVAIKVLKDKDQRDVFLDDVRDAIRTSEEPNFVNVYDVSDDDRAAFCVQQYVDGKNLRTLLREHPRGLPLATLRHLLLRIAGAISGAHALGVSHGNLKPSNILLDERMEPFILPVGRRRDRDRDERRVLDLLERMTRSAARREPLPDHLEEELAYLVPEHFGDPFEPVDPKRADQYMLGLLTYEMATGRLPLTLPDPSRLLSDGYAAFKALPPISATRRLCPQRIVALVARMADRRPARRLPDLRPILDEPDLRCDLNLVLARDSYRRCISQSRFDANFFARFYAEFLHLYPDAERYFRSFDSRAWQRQHRMLKEAVLLLLAFKQQNDGQAEPNVLTRLAEGHARIPADAYEPFLNALVYTVCGADFTGRPAFVHGQVDILCGDNEDAEPPFDPECNDIRCRDRLTESWRAALEPGIRYMQAHAWVRVGEAPSHPAGLAAR